MRAAAPPATQLCLLWAPFTGVAPVAAVRVIEADRSPIYAAQHQLSLWYVTDIFLRKNQKQWLLQYLA